MISNRDNSDLNDKLKVLIESLTTDLDVWKVLTSKYDAWVDVAGYMENWNRGFTLNIETMKMLIDRNLKIEFDIYFDREEEIDEQ